MKTIVRIIKQLKKNIATRFGLMYDKRYIKGLMSTCTELATLSKEQKRSIQAYYKKFYGKKINNYLWHQYYYSRNGVFSEKYISNYVLGEINAKLYNHNITTAFDDKNLYYTLFPDIIQPKAYVKCINDFYYQENRAITKEEAVSICDNIGKAIIKPTFCSCNGNDVKHVSLVDGIDQISRLGINDLFQKYGKNFIVQEVIHQHPTLEALNPSSVNTIRMVTYRRENEVEMIYAVMRIGKFGSEVDNTSAGGMTCKISMDGKLSKYAICSKPAGLFDKNEAGVIFENYEIPYFEQVFERAKMMHFRLPHFIMVGWDFTINDKNEVVFVEMNAPFGLHQPAAGPGFGKYTDEIMLKCFGKNNDTAYR